MLAQRYRKTDARSDIGFAVLQPLHHRERQVPLRRRQPGPEPLRQRGLDREHADTARAGDPFARRRVDRVGAHRTVDVAQRLRGVDDQRHSEAAAHIGELARRLDDAAVAGQRGQVHQPRRIDRQDGGGLVDGQPPVAV